MAAELQGMAALEYARSAKRDALLQGKAGGKWEQSVKWFGERLHDAATVALCVSRQCAVVEALTLFGVLVVFIS